MLSRIKDKTRCASARANKETGALVPAAAMEQCNRHRLLRARFANLVGIGATPDDAVTPRGDSGAAVPRGPARVACRPMRLLLPTLVASLAIATGSGAPQAVLATQAPSLPPVVAPAKAPPVGQKTPSVAFHYGADAPLDELRAFDVVVVEPNHGHNPVRHQRQSDGQSALFAYVSIGEVDPGRPYEKAMPAAMLAGENPVWGSRIIDQSHPDWPEFFVNRVVAPLWGRGYTGFFLDTMDSYQALGGDADAVKAQQDGLVRAISHLRERFPEVRLITNRGFELLDRIRPHIEAVAAESLFGRWDQENQRYTEVPGEDRNWILARLREVQKAGLQAIAIDYANPGDRLATRQIAEKIQALGITPFVTSGDLASTGIGTLEIVPRRVLMIHNSTPDGDTEQASTAHLRGVMPLQYLGYRVDLLDLARYSLPRVSLADRYAAVVGFFESDDPALQAELTRFVGQAVDEKVPVVLLNSLGVPAVSPLAIKLGLSTLARPVRAPVTVSRAPTGEMTGEIDALPNARAVAIRSPEGSTPVLSLTDAGQQTFDGVAITPWGGYALRPYTYIPVEYGVDRWVIDPISFYQRAIGRGQWLPVPDVTTENGRRLLLTHIDGDGFASRAEIPGTPFAAEIMYRDFIKRYKIPHTVSVIEGETGSEGLYPDLSPTLEGIARQIFKLDHVELASHSYSHPFFWHSVVASAASGQPIDNVENPQYLAIPGYQFDLQRDIVGSVNYINERLAPAGKKTGVFLWTGDCVPPPAALQTAYEAGLLNMNAGDTTISREHPTLTMVAPMSIRKDGWLQVMAPNQNENVYTNNWTGPFYGFDRVIETFELTNAPRRLKPINIYYHTYSASKHSAIAALHRVYRYAMRQAVNPVYSSEYIRKVHDFEGFGLAREIGRPADEPAWHLRGTGQLRTVRVPDAVADRIDWQQSQGIAGRKSGVDGTYLHLSGASARLVLAAEPQQVPPHVIAANGRVDNFQPTSTGMTFSFTSHVTGRLTLAHPKGCTVRAANRTLKALRAPKRGKHVMQHLFTHDYRIDDRHNRAGILVSVRC